MTANEFNKAIEALGLTLNEAAVLLAVHPRTIRRYANGEREVAGPVYTLLEYLIARRTKGRNAIKTLGRSEELAAA